MPLRAPFVPFARLCDPLPTVVGTQRCYNQSYRTAIAAEQCLGQSLHLQWASRSAAIHAHAHCMLARVGTMRARARFYVTAAALTTAISAVQILDGRATEAIRAELGAEVASIQKTHGVTPGLGVLLVGDRRDSLTYVRMKRKAADGSASSVADVDVAINSIRRRRIGGGIKTQRRSVHTRHLVQLPLPFSHRRVQDPGGDKPKQGRRRFATRTSRAWCCEVVLDHWRRARRRLLPSSWLQRVRHSLAGKGQWCWDGRTSSARRSPRCCSSATRR